MEKPTVIETKYTKATNERDKFVDAIVNSSSQKKVVVAGPGTGKTYLFKKILEGKKGTLTLTFVNSLVEDLSLELCGISEVKTLHGFARSILKQILKNDINVSPILSKIIKEDAIILLEKEIDFEQIFHDKDDTNEYLKFHDKRRQYYNYYGYSDIIFETVKCFEKDKDTIPTYEQVVVDEFQDFNKLEVSLIDLLAEKSPVLIVGDDDQALYEFKKASAKHIRERHNEKAHNYDSFNLPFCLRSTKVVVDATNDIIDSAMKAGLLNGRINKLFAYFNSEEKDKESEKYSKIGYVQIFTTQIPWFIEKTIGNLAEDIKDKFSVLIISPFKKQSHIIAEALKAKGLQNIEYVAKIDEPEITLLDGLKLLLEDRQDNFGWRIVSKFFLNKEEFISLLEETEEEPREKIHKLIEPHYKNEIKKMLRILKYIKKNKLVNNNEFDEVVKKIGFDPYVASKEFLKEEINSTLQRIGNPAIRKIPIKASTIQSSKGLAGDVVFITHFDDRYFIKNKDKKKITDQDICNFIVSLTRTKKTVFLISSVKEEPTFLKWISNDHIERPN